MHVLVATVVHYPPTDARVWFREIQALLDAGHTVTYIAPRSGELLAAEGLTHIEVPRASGRHRIGAHRAVGKLLREHSARADVTMVHNPELLVHARSIEGPKVWDVHEDLVAQIGDKRWIPKILVAPTRLAAQRLVRFGQQRFTCFIAEDGYRPMFPGALLVPNTVMVPDAVGPVGCDRVVYLGRVSQGRGAATLAEVVGQVPEDLTVDIIGPLDDGVRDIFVDAPNLKLRGFVPNDEALGLVGGAFAGLSLLREEPNYRHSLPTKILEYMAHGIPVITTPLPYARQIVETHDCGIVVPYDDADAVVAAIDRLRADSSLRQRLANNGRQAAITNYNWAVDGQTMIAALEALTD